MIGLRLDPNLENVPSEQKEPSEMSDAVQIEIDGVAPVRRRTKRRTDVAVAASAPAPVPAGDPGLALVERFLNDPSANPERINQAFDFYLRMRDEAARRAFDEAVAAAKAEIPIIVRNAKGHNDKRYADFSAIAKAVDPVLGKYGLSYRFRSSQSDRITVTCRLAHKDGHAEETSLSGPPDATGSKNAIQAIGSTLSYLQRYSLVLMLGLASANDDDGRAAGGVDDGPISDEQVDELIALADEVGADKEKFCRYLKIDSLADIQKSQFENAKAALNAKRRTA